MIKNVTDHLEMIHNFTQNEIIILNYSIQNTFRLYN